MHSSNTAIGVFTLSLPRVPPINDVTHSIVDQVMEINDRFELNDFMATAVPYLFEQDGKEYKSGSIMTVINSLQRALNEHKNEEWRKKVLANEFPRSLEEFKKDVDPDQFANALRDIKSMLLILLSIYYSPISYFL